MFDQSNSEEAAMGGTTDDMKGRAKQAVGDLADDPDLKREGKADRASGAVKDKLEAIEDKIEDAVDSTKDAMKR
jgi:uncharacterized protein YjbJ (UPF0337 family)